MTSFLVAILDIVKVARKKQLHHWNPESKRYQKQVFNILKD